MTHKPPYVMRCMPSCRYQLPADIPHQSPSAASGMKLHAIVCESRPLCEGVSLAAQWAEAGVEVTLITDAQVGSLCPFACHQPGLSHRRPRSS